MHDEYTDSTDSRGTAHALCLSHFRTHSESD